MKSKALIFRVLLVVAMFVAAIVLYSKLPDQIPTHWGINGQADDWGSKAWAAWILPGTGLLMLGLFPLLAKIDPRSKNYEKFSGAYEVIQTLLIGFMGLLFFLQYYFTFYPGNQTLMTPIMLSAAGLLFIVLGNYMGKVRQNYFVGIKTPWTLNDPEVWQKSHRFGGWMFVLSGVILLIEAWLQFYIWVAFMLAILIAAVLPIIYSYWIYKKRH